jgi:hypothetical protein
MASDWNGSGEDTISSGVPMWAMQAPGVMESLGLTEQDFGHTPQRYEHDYYIPERYNLSDAAKSSLSGLKVVDRNYGNGYTVSQLVGPDGNVLSMGRPRKPSNLDKFADVFVPAAIGIGTGGILGQALGFLPGAMNPLQPSTWGAGASTGSQATSGLGLDAAGNLAGSSLMDGAAVDAMVNAGSLAPGGVGSLIPTGAEVGMFGGGALLNGGGATGSLKDVINKVPTPGGGGQQGQPGGFNLGNLLGALGQMYQANQYQNSLDKLYGTLSDTGPYEAALRQELERRDAASGRRSQYGPREVELQAKMYDARSKNATTLAALTSNQNAALGSMLQGGMLAGTSSGLLNPKTGGLGQVGQDIWDGITDSDWWRDLFDFGG